MWKIPVLALSFVTLHASIGAPEPALTARSVSDTTIVVNEDYGSLSFKGTIDEKDLGETYEFTVRLTLTFHTNVPVNGTPSIELMAANLTATVPAASGDRATILYRDYVPVVGKFTKDGEAREIPPFVLHIPKAAMAKARFVGVGFTDGTFLWPVKFVRQPS